MTEPHLQFTKFDTNSIFTCNRHSVKRDSGSHDHEKNNVMNSLFLKHVGHLIHLKGGYGQVDIKEDDQTKRPVVTKRAIIRQHNNRGNQNRLLTLSKELVLLNVVSTKGVTPRCVGYTSKSEWIDDYCIPLVREIRMEFVGPTLHTCNKLGFLVEPTMLFKGLMQACSHLHDLGILHLDLKPDNVTYDLDQQRVKIIDMGLGEMTAFRDLAVECGLHQWRSSPGCIGEEDVGQVKKNGLLNKFVPAGTLYFQSSFTRPCLGKARVKNPVNILGFRDPAYMCCEVLRVARGMPLDSSADIFAAGMIVLTHAFCQGIMSGDETSHLNQTRQVLALIGNLNLWRGCCSHEEVMMMERLLEESAYICERSLATKTSTVYAIRSSLKGGGTSHGLHAAMSSIVGQVVACILLDCIHPVPCYRPTAKQCLTILNSEEEEERKFAPRRQGDVKPVSTTCYFVGDGTILIGRAFLFPMCIASVSIMWGSGQVLWQKINKAYFEVLNMQRRRKLSHDLVNDMHATVGCCRDRRHAVSWFQSLSREEALVAENNFVF